MGGFGSGRQSYGGRTVENTISIDIRWLKKHGKLDSNHDGKLSWTMNGRDSGAISYRMRDNQMILYYRSKSARLNEWQTVEQTINIVETPCNYGGYRKWLLCSNCHSRVTELFAPSTYFYCRKCYRLPYHSTQESKTDRVYTKKHELGAAIFEHYEHGEGYFKKKGMHQKTFDRKLVEYRMLEARVNAHCQKFINKINGKL